MNRDPQHVPVSHFLQCVFEQVFHTGYEMLYGVGVGVAGDVAALSVEYQSY